MTRFLRSLFTIFAPEKATTAEALSAVLAARQLSEIGHAQRKAFVRAKAKQLAEEIGVELPEGLR